MKTKSLSISYIMNYHNGGGLGYVVVTTPLYRARWSYDNPEKLCVTDAECVNPYMIELPISFTITEVSDEKKILHSPGEMKGLFTEKEEVSRLKGVHILPDAKLKFRGTSESGIEFICTIIFYPDRIEFVSAFTPRKDFLLLHTNIGDGNSNSHIKIAADALFDPSPVSDGIFLHSVNHSCLSREKWFTPAPFCYPYRMKSGEWISVSLEPELGQMQFTHFQTAGISENETAFKICYDSQPCVTTKWEFPALVFRFGAKDEFTALKQYAEGLFSSGKVNGAFKSLMHN